MKKTVFIVAVMVLVLSLSITAEAKKTKIYVHQDKYPADVASSLAAYKGKTIFLANFENNANNTTIWYYFRPDNKKVIYEAAPTLQSYVWYCFEKAMKAAGATVYRDQAPVAVPELRLSFTSFSETEFTARVELIKNGKSAFVKNITVTDEATQSMDQAELEERAYEQMDKIIKGVMLEPDLKKAFF